MDAKPFINGNKLTKPDFGYYRTIQNDNIVILAAALAEDGAVDVPPQVESFIKAWGYAVKLYVIGEYYNSVPKGDNSTPHSIKEAKNMSSLYALWVSMWALATVRNIHEIPVPQELCEEWAGKYSDIRVNDTQKYSINLSEYVRALFPKLWAVALAASTIQRDDTELKEIDTVFATNFVSRFLGAVLPDVIFKVGVTRGRRSFDYLDLEITIWYFVAELHYRTEVTPRLLELPTEVFTQLSDMRPHAEDGERAWHKITTKNSTYLPDSMYSITELL